MFVFSLFSLLLVYICVVFKVCFQVFKVITFFYVFTNLHMFYGNFYLFIIIFCVLVRFILLCLMIFRLCLFCLCYARHLVPISLLPMISFLPLLFQFPLSVFSFKLILVFFRGTIYLILLLLYLVLLSGYSIIMM